MSEPTVHVVTDLPAPKKPFFLNKTYVTVVAATAAATVAFVLYKKTGTSVEDVIDTIAA